MTPRAQRFSWLHSRARYGLAVLVALVAGATSLAAAAPVIRAEALSPEGTLYRLVADDVSGWPAGTSAEIRLLVARLDGTSADLVVPGTEDGTPERWPHLSLSEASGSVTVIWEDVLNSLHSTIRMAQYVDGEGWIGEHEVRGSIYAKKSRPQFAVTEDRVLLADPLVEGAPVTNTGFLLEVRISHIVWREDQGQVFYANLLEKPDGTSTLSQAISLSEAFPEIAAHDSWGIDAPIILAPGRDQRSLILGFVDPLEGTVQLVEIDVLPLAVSRFADAGYDAVERVAAANGGLVAAAEEARSHIVFIGRRQPGLAPILAAAASTSILANAPDSNPSGWVGIAEEARSHIVFIGLRLNPDLQQARPVALLSQTLVSDGSRDRHVDIALRHLGTLELPLELPSDAQMLLKPDGRGLLFYWRSATEQPAFSYLEAAFADASNESTETGEESDGAAEISATWSPVLSMSAAQAGSLEQAERLIRARVGSGS